MTVERLIGEYSTVRVHVAAWDGAAARAGLSCACMFTHEAHDVPVGGLAHLDRALGGHLVQARSSGGFRAARGELLFLDQPPAGIVAKRILIVGLGDPAAWSVEVIAGAVRIAYAAANVAGMASVAFAPSMLDGGLSAEQTSGAAAMMARALADAIDMHHASQRAGFAKEAAVRDWFFDVGAERFETAARGFAEELAKLRPSTART